MEKIVHESSFVAPAWAMRSERDVRMQHVKHFARPVTVFDDEKSPVQIVGFAYDDVDFDDECRITVNRLEPYVEFSAVEPVSNEMEHVFTFPLSQAQELATALNELVATLESSFDEDVTSEATASKSVGR